MSIAVDQTGRRVQTRPPILVGSQWTEGGRTWTVESTHVKWGTMACHNVILTSGSTSRRVKIHELRSNYKQVEA